MESVHVKGFKSIRDQKVELRNLNVLIGANGAGKSNFLEVFPLIRELFAGASFLDLYVKRNGGADRFLHHGQKVTESISLVIELPFGAYGCTLAPVVGDEALLTEEWLRPREESLDTRTQSQEFLNHPHSWRIVHLDDTSEAAKARKYGEVGDNRALLTTLLLQPEPPTLILLDEPELGLHPYAIHLLAAMLEAAAERTQVIVSTQSVTLVNQLTPKDVIVVDREDDASTFRRPQEDEIASWLDDYALGELWEKNLIGGRPG